MEDSGQQIVVVGAGIPSLALSCLLQEQGIQTLLLDARQKPDPSPRGLTLQPNGLAALEVLGILNWVESLGKPVQVFEIRSWTGEVLLEADYGLLPEPHNYIMTINGTELEQMLRDRAEKSGARIQLGARFSELSREMAGRVTGVVYDGPWNNRVRIPARLVVGADGGQSRVRGQMGFRVKKHDYKDAFLVGMVGPVSTLEGRARQYQAPSRMLGVMPLGEDATYIHYCVGQRTTDELKQAGLDPFKAEVSNVDSELEGAFKGVESLNQFGYFLPNWQRISEWAGDGVVLLGDSAHTLHPHSGQGLNLSLQDAVTLAGVVKECVEQDDFSRQRLKRYEDERKPVADVVGHHAHYSATYALSRNGLVQRLNHRAMKKMRKDKELLKEALEITAGTFKKKPSLVKLARMGGIIP